MFHSHWEMEVFAREIQEQRMREAEYERRMIAASGMGRLQMIAAAAGRVAYVVRSIFTAPRTVQTGETSRDAMRTPELALDTAKERTPAARPRVNPLTAPYAAMVVVARGPSATAPAVQASHVGDR